MGFEIYSIAGIIQDFLLTIFLCTTSLRKSMFIIYSVSETRTPLLFRKQSILEKNVSDKSCGVLNDPFSGLIHLVA